MRLLDTNIPLFWLADGRPAYYVEDLSLVDKDDPEVSGFIIDSAINIGIRGSLNGYVQPLVSSRILRQMIAGEPLDAETAFKSSEASSKAAWFVDFPGVEISPGSLMIHRVQAERLRFFWLSHSTAVSPVASSRDGSFGVGDKTAQKRFGTFSEALEYLRRMETAKWRRPNPGGNWGIVSAVRWDKLRK